MFFLLLSRFRRPLLLISFCENTHTKALRRGSLLFAAAKLSFAPTKPLFARTKPSFAAAKQNASGSKILKKRTCKGQNCSYASTNGKDAARRKREVPPKETTDKRPCEAGRCKGICQGLSSVTAYFYFFIATFALCQWAVQILHRRVPTALRPMARRPVVETTLQPSGRTSAGSISVRNINKKTGRALKRKTRWNGTNFYQTDASVRNT